MGLFQYKSFAFKGLYKHHLYVFVKFKTAKQIADFQ